MKKLSFSIKRNHIAATLLGIVMAVLSVVLWYCWFSSSKAMLLLSMFFAALYLAFGFLRITTESEKTAIVLNCLWGLASIALVIGPSLPTVIASGIVFKIILNYLCALFLLAILFLMVPSWKFSVNVTLFTLTVITIVNIIVLSFRGKELGPLDFLSAKTALSVAGKYKLLITRRLFLTCLAYLVVLLVQFSIPPMPRLTAPKRCLRLGALCIAIVCAATVIFGSTDIVIRTWSNEGSQHNGFFLNFYIGIRESRIAAPENYSVDAVNQYAEQYQANADTIPEGSMPNILIIMDESFADFNIYQNDFTTNIPLTPFIDSLSENTIKGYAMTSIFGGNTANAEFELLTGHSMAYLPSLSVPYQQYISGELYSLAHLLKSYGYATVATHPFEPTGWSRNVIFPFFGFDEYTSQEDYPQKNYIREYISDQEMFEFVLERLYAEEEKPLFLMGITMQNHGGYEYPGYENTIELEGYSKQYPLTEQYLSLIHETDRAVEYLLTELEEYEEDTIVLFFGDHFPGVELEFFKELNGGSLDTLEEQMLQYTIPFFIWANYDISTDFVERTSISYMPIYLLQNAGLELPAYYRLLADIRETIPAINAFGYYSLDNACYLPIAEATGKEARMLEMYEILQYNNLFDTKNRSEALFARYIQ